MYRRVCHSLEWKQILDLDKIYLETWTFSVPFQAINIPFIYNFSVFHDMLVLQDHFMFLGNCPPTPPLFTWFAGN